MTSPQRIGGSFAPPLSRNQIEEYRKLGEKLPPHIAEIVQKLCDMVEVFYETGESRLPSFPDKTNLALITPLEPAEIERMYPHVPWKHELDMYSTLFDTLDPKTQKKERDAAFHLLWFGYELYADREPLTSDKLRK